MKTLIADDRRRVQIPAAKPGQVFAYEDNGGIVTLTPVKKVDVKEPFPEGSLKYLVTKESNAEMAALAKGMKIPAPPADWPE